MKVRLKRDIVIPAGTILTDAPRSIEMGRGHVEHILGLTPNTSSSLLSFVDPDDTALAEWCEVLEAQGSARPCGDGKVNEGWIRRQHYGEVPAG